MLRDILVADAMPIFGDTGVMLNPNGRNRSASRCADCAMSHLRAALPQSAAPERQAACLQS